MDLFKIDVNDEKCFVRVTLFGNISKDEGTKIITLARKKAAELGKNLLYDMRSAKSDLPLYEWFEMPRNLEVFKKSKTRRVRAAVIISPDDKVESYEFYETVLFNLGIKFKVFFDEEKVVEWLSRKI